MEVELKPCFLAMSKATELSFNPCFILMDVELKGIKSVLYNFYFHNFPLILKILFIQGIHFFVKDFLTFQIQFIQPVNLL